MKSSLKTTLITLALMCMPVYALANSALDIPDKGLSLKGDAKQAYMTQYMHAMFHPQVKAVPKPFVAPEGWVQNDIQLTNVKVEHFQKENMTNKRAIIYLHGGGYVIHANNRHRLLSLIEAELFKASDVFMPDYRLAPQYAYPAALDDAVATYEAVLKDGFKPGQIIFVGDSAGGNLALTLALYAEQNKLPQPGAIIAVSPWATLENKKGTSRYFNLDKDVILGTGTPLNKAVKDAAYAGKNSKRNPLISPVYGDFTNIAPLLIQAGGNELFLTESIDLAKQAAKNNADVTLTIYSGMPHDFALCIPKMQESINSLKEMQAFVNRYLD